ncbi:MAG: efflux RND transporter periplasmic adaptor subunit [Stenomitos rutilans HA7619-LM2]|nr:efflux RND transporter periplasmic adaptor subunit [Stenomitos rutilans HA7619-LM2]
MQRYPFLGALLLLSLSTASCSKNDSAAKASGPPPSQVQVQTLQNGTLQDSIEYIGTLQAENTVQLVPQIQGRIGQILVQPGARVDQGDPIFILNPDDTLSQVRSAQSTIGVNLAARNTAAKQLQASKSALASAQAQYELARVNNRRYQQLYREGAVGAATADQYATTEKTALATVRQNQDEASAQQAAVDQADATVSKSQSDLDTAQVSLNYKRVVAPISGSVGNITLKPGDYVTAGQTLTTINQNNSFDLQIPVPLSKAGQVRTGLTVELLDPSSGERLGTGKLYFVASQANAADQSILTRARFPNDGKKLRDAQYVRARVIWATKPGVMVPATAVTPIGGQNFVFVAEDKTDDKGKSQTIAHQLPVTLGNIQGQSYQVLKGLKPGDRVIVSGVAKLRDGAPITPQAGGASGASPTNAAS